MQKLPTGCINGKALLFLESLVVTGLRTPPSLSSRDPLSNFHFAQEAVDDDEGEECLLMGLASGKEIKRGRP